MKLLLISNSTNPGQGFLEYPEKSLNEFCKKNNIKEALFIPYAAVTYSFDEYENKVQKRFSDFSVKISSIHHASDKNEKMAMVKNSKCIIVGGGNTFMLVKMMQDDGIMQLVSEKVLKGTPYIGWSAGSNITCPTLSTTNDMPIVEPDSFKTLNLIPFQINPHYTDAKIEGHGGETREQRILEYIAANKKTYVAGLRESCLFEIEGDSIKLNGPKNLRVFKYGQEPVELTQNDDLSFLLLR